MEQLDDTCQIHPIELKQTMKLNYLATFAAASILTVGGATIFSNAATASTFSSINTSNSSTIVAGNPCAAKNPCAAANPCAAVNPCAGK